MHMQEAERKIVAKNATDARTQKAKKELRERNLGKAADAISHWRITIYNILITFFMGFVSDWRAARDLRDKQLKNQKKRTPILRE